MSNEKIGVREIFAKYGSRYIEKNYVTTQEKGLISLLSACRTQYLGSHTTACPNCGHTHTQNNSCRNRHCPDCQQKNKLEWTDKRLQELLPVGYYHLVFTLPHELNSICLQNKKTMYDILFRAVWQTIAELAADPKHAGVSTGLISVLHTWGQAMTDHIHLHCMMPAGGFAVDDNHDWVNFNKKDGFFVHYKTVSRLFKGKFIAFMKTQYTMGNLVLKGKLEKYRQKKHWENLTGWLSGIDWVVNIQAPMGNPEKILEYLSRYVFRVAISNHRIKRIADGKVCFSMKDYRSGFFREMKLGIDEFIRRFLLHVLPDRFLKVRYYGIFANRNRRPNIEKARQILAGQKQDQWDEALEDGETVWKKQDTVWDEIKQLMRTIKSPNCPVCKKGRMQFLSYNKFESKLEPG